MALLHMLQVWQEQTWIITSERLAHVPITQSVHPVSAVKLRGLCWEIDVGPHHFYTIAVRDVDGWCQFDQPLSFQGVLACSNLQCPNRTKLLEWQSKVCIRFWAVKLLEIMLRNKCWPITFHTVVAGDADGWCRYDQSLNFQGVLACSNL
jgi:hypothetical protein